MTGSEKGKTLLLTGGTGFIGRFLVPELLVDGWQVVVLSRQDAPSVANILGNEVRAISSLEEWGLEGGPTACINLAGEGIMDRRWIPKRKEVLRQSRIGLTHDLVKWLNSFPSPPEVFLSGSAVGYYGVGRGDEPLSESEPAGQDFAAQLCADWEKAARGISEKSRLCLMRAGIVLHSKHGALTRMLPPFRMGLGGPIGEGSQVMPWIHIQDMVSGIMHLLKSDASGAFNFAAASPGSNPYSNPTSNLTFVNALGKALHRPAILPMPAFALKTLLGESAVLLLKGQHPVPEALEKSGFRFAFPDIDEAFQDLLG